MTAGAVVVRAGLHLWVEAYGDPSIDLWEVVIHLMGGAL